MGKPRGGFGSTVPASAASPLVLYAPFTADINATVGASPNGTAIGGAGISGGKLDCTGGSAKGVYFAGSNVSSVTNTGCIEVEWTPNYNGSPGNFYVMLSIGTPAAGNANTIEIGHFTDGKIYLRVHSADGTELTSAAVGDFAAQQGVSKVVSYNFDSTVSRLFIGGTKLGSDQVAVTGRDGTATRVAFGNSFGATNEQDASFAEGKVYNTVQHTANYTP